jgi:hypothetical protein
LSTDWQAVTAWATWAIAGGVLVAIWAALDARKTHRGETAKELSRRFSSREIVQARRLIDRYPSQAELLSAVEYAVTNLTYDFYIFSRYLSFFEELGVVCQHTRWSISVVETTLGSTIRSNWQLWQPIVEQVWHDQPDAWKNFRWLAQKLERRKQRRQEWKALGEPIRLSDL